MVDTISFSLCSPSSAQPAFKVNTLLPAPPPYQHNPISRVHQLSTWYQMLSLMDRLLKRENLDLRLTPYRWGGGDTT